MKVDPRKPLQQLGGFATPADDPGVAPSSRTLDPIANAWRDADPLMSTQRFDMQLGIFTRS